MKFYQTIAPVILSIICTTPIFGSKKIALPHVPEDLYAIIDKLAGDSKGENDSFYKETGRIKPYSRSLDWKTNYAKQSQYKNDSCYQQYLAEKAKELSGQTKKFMLIFKIKLVISILYLTGLKNFSHILSHKSRLPLTILAVSTLFQTLADGVFFILFNQYSAYRLGLKVPAKISHLSIKFQKKAVILGGQPFRAVIFSNENGSEAEIVSLSDMKSVKTLPSTDAIRMCGHLYRAGPVNKVKKNKMTYELLDRKINIYLSNDDYEPKNGLNSDDYQSKDKLSSLPMQKNETAFDVSENGEILITDKEGVHKLELKKRKNLYEIMYSG